MYVCSRFAFLEIPKTGSTYIDQILIDFLDGKKTGKHNYPDQNLLSSGRNFVASIRDPFDWYASLHSYGCKVKEKSGPYRKVKSFQPLNFKGFAFGQDIQFGLQAYSKFLWHSLTADKASFLESYANSGDSVLFRSWLNMLHSDEYMYIINPIFAHSPLSRFAGLYTFRVIWLTCHNRHELLSSECPNDYESLAKWEKKNSFVDRFVRMECMATDLLSLFEDYGYDLSAEQTKKLQENKRHNASGHKRRLDTHYDQATANSIAARDRLIFEKFKYPSKLTEGS